MFYHPLTNRCVCDNAHIHQQQMPETIAVTIRNNESTEQKVWVYGKQSALLPNSVFGATSWIQLIDQGASTAFLPPITLAPGETTTVNVPVPARGEFWVDLKDIMPPGGPIQGGRTGLPILLTQLDLRIQYYTQWCRQIFPLIEVGPIQAPPQSIQTTTSQIGKSQCNYGTWLT